MEDEEAISSNAAWAGVLIPLLVAISLSGCGGEPTPIMVPASGTVTLDGKPLDAGTIRFIPAPPFQGRAAYGTIEDGKFSIPGDRGLVSGNHRVEIESAVSWGFEVDDEEAYTRRSKEGWTPPPGAIPPKYNRQSTLTRLVDPGAPPVFKFELKSTDETKTP